MSSCIYLLRYPAHLISRSLYDPDNPDILSLGIEAAIDAHPPSAAARVLHSGASSSWKEGEQLTYRQVLDIILAAKKVITI